MLEEKEFQKCGHSEAKCALDGGWTGVVGSKQTIEKKRSRAGNKFVDFFVTSQK